MNKSSPFTPPPQLTYRSLEAAKLAIETHGCANSYAVFAKHTRRVGNKALADAAEHDHKPFAHSSAHPSGRPLNLEHQASINSLGRAGVTPSRIIASLRQQVNNFNIIARDFYNLRRACKVEFLSGRSPLAALLDSLANANVEHSFQVDDFDSHWWLKTPASLLFEPRLVISMADALKCIQDDYETEASPHRKQLILERELAWPVVDTIQEPKRILGRGRPSKSTKRNISHFEHVESVLEAEARSSSQRRCRVCRASGHNARTSEQVLQIQS